MCVWGVYAQLQPCRRPPPPPPVHQRAGSWNYRGPPHAPLLLSFTSILHRSGGQHVCVCFSSLLLLLIVMATARQLSQDQQTSRSVLVWLSKTLPLFSFSAQIDRSFQHRLQGNSIRMPLKISLPVSGGGGGGGGVDITTCPRT